MIVQAAMVTSAQHECVQAQSEIEISEKVPNQISPRRSCSKKTPVAKPAKIKQRQLVTNLKKLAQVYLSSPSFEAQLCKFE